MGGSPEDTAGSLSSRRGASSGPRRDRFGTTDVVWAVVYNFGNIQSDLDGAFVKRWKTRGESRFAPGALGRPMKRLWAFKANRKMGKM